MFGEKHEVLGCLICCRFSLMDLEIATPSGNKNPVEVHVGLVGSKGLFSLYSSDTL